MTPRRRRVAPAVVAVLTLCIAACGGADEGTGVALPDVQIAPLDGGASVSLAELRGPAVINLWATTCVPCRTEMPAFEAVHQARGDEVTFIGLNIGESAEQALPFVDEVGTTYDQFLDELGYAVTELAVSAMPTTFVIDADGVVTTRHLGQMDVDDLNAAIDTAINDGINAGLNDGSA